MTEIFAVHQSCCKEFAALRAVINIKVLKKLGLLILASKLVLKIFESKRKPETTEAIEAEDQEID